MCRALDLSEHTIFRTFHLSFCGLLAAVLPHFLIEWRLERNASIFPPLFQCAVPLRDCNSGKQGVLGTSIIFSKLIEVTLHNVL